MNACVRVPVFACVHAAAHSCLCVVCELLYAGVTQLHESLVYQVVMESFCLEFVSTLTKSGTIQMYTKLCVVTESATLSTFVKAKSIQQGKVLISRSVLFSCLCECCCNAILSVSCYMKNSLRSRFPSIIFFRKQAR